MAREREGHDWSRDRVGARPTEAVVLDALRRQRGVSHLADFTEETDASDFRFRFEGDDVQLELKEKLTVPSDEYAELWPEVPRHELAILDETSFRRLIWAEGVGYLLLRDVPAGRWCTFGPWELCLGPRRRFERWGDKGAGPFLKGKLLLDLRTAATTTGELDLDDLLDVVRSSRRALRQVSAVRLRVEGDIPAVPKQSGHGRLHERRTPLPAPLPTAAVADARAEDESDATWAGLSCRLAAQVRSRGWAAPTQVQERAIPAVLAGRNVLVLGPTAGGKTEAAALPLLDLVHREPPVRRPVILVVNPLTALLTDQRDRWRGLATLVGASCFAWFSETDQDSRKAFKAQPTDVLLTTPESLENLISSATTDERTLFGGLRAVVIDEVHAFVGTPRGAQLASLLERLDRFVDDDLQRVGLSATVGNPAEVLEWLRGGSHRDNEVVDAGPPLHGETLSLRSYVDVAGAVDVIGAELAGHRSIVFARSRRRAEELAVPLGLRTYHSSVGGAGRRAGLEALRDGDVHALVATSSLEMGIDVGDLDLVVHDGAPSDPASYLQRLGRAGRRTGQRRLVFTTGEADDLLLILAVVTRARRGDVGRLPTQRGARLVLGQQALTIAFQRNLIDRSELRETLRWSKVFRHLDVEIEATIDHLVGGGFLLEERGSVVVGREGHRRFGGGAGLLRLLATFRTTDGADVVDRNGRSLGRLDWSQVADGDGPTTRGIALGGQHWAVLSVDRTTNRVVVEPSSHGRPPSWRGSSLEIDRATWEAVREVLAGTELPMEMDARAGRWLDAARLSFAPRLLAPVRPIAEGLEADTFAGVAVNRAVLAILQFDGSADGPSVAVHAAPDTVRDGARQALATLDAALDGQADRVAAAVAQGLANAELTAPSVLHAEARAFHVDAEGIEAVLTLLAEWRS